MRLSQQMEFAMVLTLNKKLITLVAVALLLSACSSASQTDGSITESTLPNPTISKLVKDCTYFQELAYELRESATGGHTKIITQDFIERWTYVVMNNSKCFTQIEYCDAIDAHNSVSPRSRQESSPYC